MLKFVAINKARKPTTSRGGKSDYRTLHRIADEIAPILESKIKENFNAVRDKIDLRDILSALADGSGMRVEAGIPWSELIDKYDLREELQQAVEQAGVASEAALKTLLIRTTQAPEADLVFNQRNPSVENWARNRAGDLIKEITDESKLAVRNTIADTLVSGADYGVGAQKIKDAVGLTQQGAIAAANYRDMLMEKGLTLNQVQTQTEAYRDRLLTARAETIARTETIQATNQGQIEYWNQLADNEVIDKNTAQKVWVVTPDDRLCPICEPLGGVAVDLDGEFDLDGDKIDAPPAHPNCRCALSLELGGTGE